MMMLLVAAVVATLAAAPAPAAAHYADFRFAFTHSDGMVLQQAPQQAMVWGFCPNDTSKVTVEFRGQQIAGTVGPDHATGELVTWRALLPPTPASFTPVNITATVVGTTRDPKTITLANVLFGDVWVCSGQSNMEYPIAGTDANCWNATNINCTVVDSQCRYGCVNSSAAEVAGLAAYNNSIRVTIAQSGAMHTPRPDFAGPNPWHLPPDTSGHFSAACWFYGRDIFEYLNRSRPIGLIGTYVGGTPDQSWSSQDALDKCKGPEPWNWPANFTDSVLWNGMVVPYLRTTVKGAIWYQGEANSRMDGRTYNCSFPAMIEDWRSKWHAATDGASSDDFPFGWAQLNSDGSPSGTYNNPTMASNTSGEFGQWAPGFPSIRLAQSNTLGLSNTFQAVILDTPVASGSVHSPYKQPVGQRLARGGLAVAYGIEQANAVQPVATAARVEGGGVAVVTIGGLGSRGLRATVGAQGFEVLGGQDQVWHSTPIKGSSGSSVTVGDVPPEPKAIRYLYYSAPCTNQTYQCPVYALVDPLGPLSGEQQDFLPLGPFVMGL